MTGNNGQPYMVLYAAMAAAMGGVLFGYDIGIISGAMLQLREEFVMSCLMQEIVVSAVVMGAFLSSVIGGLAVDKIGRKLTMLINCAIFMIGALILAFASSTTFLVVGRLLVGFGAGLSIIAECSYISEMASPIHRGKLVSFNEIAITLGFLMAYLVNYLCITRLDGWRIMFGISGVIALLQAVMLAFVPKSPRFLLVRGRVDEAINVLTVLRGDSDAAVKEVESLQAKMEDEKHVGCCDIFSTKNSMLYRLSIACALVLFQQVCGQPTVLYYAPILFEQLGFESNQSSTLAVVGAGVTKVIGVLVAVLLIDRVGRKKLLITGVALMTVSLLVLAQINHNIKHAMPLCTDDYLMNQTETMVTPLPLNIPLQSIRWISLIAVLLSTMAYSIGYGPVTWLICSELFPASVKGTAVAFASSLNWLMNFLVSVTFLSYIESVGVYWTIMTYAITSAVALVFVILFVPETKGKELEEIAHEIKNITIRDQIHSSVCCHRNGAATYEPLSEGIAMERIQTGTNNYTTVT